MDAEAFLLSGNADELLTVLRKAQCKSCGGSGERNDAYPGDISFRTWVCQPCNGMGWNAQAVREIIAAVEL